MADWAHAPLHRLDREGTFFVTGATYLKQHFYRSRAALDRLQARLFDLANETECRLQAWAFFSNHYHLVCAGPGESVRIMLSRLHWAESFAMNDADGTTCRKVWFQFRDTQLTYQRSWLARLNYTHQNPVHHRLVRRSRDYRWCSAAWFESHASRAFVRSVERFKIDRVNVVDDFDVVVPLET